MPRFPKALPASRFLAEADSRLAQVIAEVGPITVEIDPDETVFESLASSIVYQQLHGKAAATILGRFKALFPGAQGFPEPGQVLATDEAALRATGLSGSKLLSIQDLARKVIAGQVPDRAQAETMDDDALIESLTQVRGIGPWTAQMMLIFTLGRPDVLPTGDYGVRKGFATLYRKKEMPTPQALQKVAEKWRPYRSVASWYLWRVLELERFKPKAKPKAKAKAKA